MADDTKDLIERMRASRGTGGGLTTSRVAEPQAPDRETSRSNSASMLRAMGYDEATVQSLVPDAAPVQTDMLSSLDNLGGRLEAEQAIDQNLLEGFPEPGVELREQLTQYMTRFGDSAVSGLAATGKFINDFAASIGERAGKNVLTRPYIDAGMAGLDIMAFFSNWAKLQLAPPERRAAMRLTYLPTETLLDPDSPEFNTTTEMAAWLAGQRAWGLANELAALPAEGIGQMLDWVGLPEASAAAYDLARRDKETAKKADQFTAGQLPQLIAGKAPFLSWQDIFESHLDPVELDNIYAQLDDPGSHGALVAAAATGLFAIADFYADPMVVASGIPAKIIGAAPRIAQLSKAGRAESAVQAATAARKLHTYEAALDAVNRAEAVTKSATEAVEAAAKQGGGVPADLYNDLLKAQKAQAREELWLARFEDPGAYEPIMLRPARRNPEFVPELTTREYGLSAGGRFETRVKSIDELSSEVEAARRRTLASGAHMPVDWNDPKQMSLDLQVQRMDMGPSDAEYAGDALNMLVRGATVDDVSIATRLDPEYYVLPDVKSSLSDIRKLTAQQEIAQARKALSPPPRPNSNLRATETAVGQYDFGGSAVLERQLEEASRGLVAAKRVGDKQSADEMRRTMRTLKKMRSKLAAHAEEPFDGAWMPVQQKGIMGSPERFNNWLNVAGNRVIRSITPGGLHLHGWDSKIGQLTGIMREPMRYYRSYAPEAWERIRSGLLRYDSFQKSISELLTKEFTNAKVIVPRGKFDPARHFAQTKVDDLRSNKVAKLLDTVPGTEEYEAMRNTMAPELVELHDRLRKIYDHMADLQGISQTDRYLSGYFRHMWDQSLFANGARPIEFIGVPQKGNLMVSHLMDRTGQGKDFNIDAVTVTDLYMRAAYRKLVMEPVYKDIEMTGREIAKRTGNSAHVSYANDLINQMKGKPSFLGAKIDNALAGVINSGGGISLPFTKKKLTYTPGDLDRTIHGLWQALHTGLTTGPHYAITQIAAGLSTTAGRFGPLATMRGVFQFATKEGQQLGRVAGTYKPFVDYLTSNAFTQFTERMQSRIKSPPLFISNTQAEEATRSITYNVALKYYLKKAGYKTIKEAQDAGFLKRIMFESLQESERINHFYGPLGRTPWLSRMFGSSGATGLSLFLSYIPKQTEELAGQIAKNPGHILQYLAFSGQLVRMAARGGIDLTRETGLGFVPQEMTDFTSPAVDAALTNTLLMDALDRNDAEGVERYTKQLVKMLPGLVPGSQLLIKGSKSADRLQTQTVKTADGKPLYRMDMFSGPGSALGGELGPTLTMQRSIRETIIRRGLEATQREERRVRYNGQKALEDYANAVEGGDQEAAVRLAEELSNVYNIRLANPAGSLNSLVEARSMSYTLRNLKDNPGMADIFWKTYQQHDIPVEP